MAEGSREKRYYFEFWRKHLDQIGLKIENGSFDQNLIIDVKEISQIGRRTKAGYSGYVQKNGKDYECKKGSSVFWDLVKLLKEEPGNYAWFSDGWRIRISTKNQLIITPSSGYTAITKVPLPTLQINSMTNNLNQILFGPPGTGKTYHTINKALEIINPGFYSKNKNNREALHKEFERLLIKDWAKDKGQIAFCTFHQSMSYEDFIEGIKPVLAQEPVESSLGIKTTFNNVQYQIEPGIFKCIAQRATIAKQQKTTFDDQWSGFQNSLKSENNFIFSSINSKLFLEDVSDPNSITVRHEKSYYKENGPGKEKYKITKATIKEIYDKDVKIDESKESIKAIEKIIEKDISTEFYAVYKAFWKFCKGLTSLDTPYVLIIDEINRGNISQIFGELITLIEEDKRASKPEALEVILPYSKTSFSIPSNLYIIGTMNTADRSVEALDTALRRRFVFVEMPPRHELLNPKAMICRFWNSDPDEILKSLDWKKLDWDKEPYLSRAQKFYSLFGLDKEAIESNFLIDSSELWDYGDWHPRHLIDIEFEIDPKGINLENILRTINTRIEVLLSKDHQIGHSYFMTVYSEDELKTAFYKSIIPLLQEYFYGDYGKIGLVLGKGFVETVTSQKPFADFDYEASDTLSDRVIYRITDYRIEGKEGFIEAVKAIYS